MAARVGAFLKNAWDKEPVLVVSFVVGGLEQSHDTTPRMLHDDPTLKRAHSMTNPTAASSRPHVSL
ncbi:NADH:ubiquinone oxidoreductase subunit A3 [Homo sapiens]|uniref:NADH dehydrogenase [ubiquinone] 1 alpha subcomplex subunit 3 n=1 Tax=Homo sapiens TaxID=9606 RepID=F2Z2C6_HUMAN|nr:NADH:ubiquinone oxidoreductase subunit A3 [Homo sapiens]KAI2593022.1 NADH:ubiquinone oxidoreductase subunit A3 [Homo sapiens]KAI4044667.1 NADH:ubiquinone oxidoreductase subunit A3 [Homo sapiens]KAI4044670.1 NADH:ubiquinone oxidoreductase subunit A3 [Homo sapiens]